MAQSKTILVALLILAGLIVASIQLTGQYEADFVPLLTATPAQRATPTAQAGCAPTPANGPFGYIPGAPPLTTTLAPLDLPGQRLFIWGTVYAMDCLTPLPEALIEVWQTGPDGRYDRDKPFTLRGQVRADAAGRYAFITIRPGHYDVNRSTQPAHIHFRVSHLEYEPRFTRLLFADDPHLGKLAEVSPELVVSFGRQERLDGPPVYHGQFNLVLPVPPPTP
jgi:protocatechuate 3,4-dioxygenase beta subunit